MTWLELVNHLRRSGVQLWPDPDRWLVHYEGPHKALTEEVCALIAWHKPRIMHALLAGANAAAPMTTCGLCDGPCWQIFVRRRKRAIAELCPSCWKAWKG